MSGFQIIIGGPAVEKRVNDLDSRLPEVPRPPKPGLFDFMKRKPKEVKKVNLEDLFGDYAGFKVSKIAAAKPAALPQFTAPDKKEKPKAPKR